MLRIHEYSSASGSLASVYLRVADEELVIVSDEGAWPLPLGALAAVLRRYGAPFDDSAPSSVTASLRLANGESLRHVRHLAGYDVIARDYLVYEGANGEAWCALAATVTAALVHLARAHAAQK
jgi:hypothetical protein